MSNYTTKLFEEYWKQIVPVLWDVQEWDNQTIKNVASLAYKAGRDEALIKYHELLYAVGTKFPEESRHQTALRYIRRAEEGDNNNQAQCEGP